MDESSWRLKDEFPRLQEAVPDCKKGQNCHHDSDVCAAVICQGVSQFGSHVSLLTVSSCLRASLRLVAALQEYISHLTFFFTAQFTFLTFILKEAFFI